VVGVFLGVVVDCDWLLVWLSTPALLLFAYIVRLWLPVVVAFMLSHCTAW